MILLRCISILVGGLLALLAPQFAIDLASDVLGYTPPASLKVMGTALGLIGLCALGFLFIGLAGHRMARTPWKRIVGGILLCFPAAACLWVLFASSFPLLVSAAGPLLCFTAFVFAIFVFPAANTRSRRPMRQRNAADSDFPEPNEKPHK
jgi:hypothetical protein